MGSCVQLLCLTRYIGRFSERSLNLCISFSCDITADPFLTPIGEGQAKVRTPSILRFPKLILTNPNMHAPLLPPLARLSNMAQRAPQPNPEKSNTPPAVPLLEPFHARTRYGADYV